MKARQYYYRNKEGLQQRHKEYLKIHKSDFQAKFIALKKEVFSHYSNGRPECACCGESELTFLTIDHIQGRKTLGHLRIHSGNTIRLWLKKNNYPVGFQVLCLNCNAAKSDKGFCPHKKPTQCQQQKELA